MQVILFIPSFTPLGDIHDTSLLRRAVLNSGPEQEWLLDSIYFKYAAMEKELYSTISIPAAFSPYSHSPHTPVGWQTEIFH